MTARRQTMTGIVALVQEGRFQLIDEDGVGHLFLLGRNAGAETEQLGPLQRRQACVRVRYHSAPDLIGNVADAIKLLD